MSMVIVSGKFAGASLDSKTYDGKTTNTLLIDLYQPNSPLPNKAVQVRTDDLQLLTTFNAYESFSDITLSCLARPYKKGNEAAMSLKLVAIVS